MKEKLSNNTGKKKRGCCFNACMTVLIFNFVVMCVLIVVGWTVGNNYCKQELGMSLGETFAVYRGLYASDGKFVDNGYSDSDESGFYDSVGDALLLKQGAINGEDFKQVLIESLKASSNGTSENSGVQPLNATEGDDEQPDLFMDYLSSVLVAENFDQEKIDSIGTESQANTNLKITDRQLAAFVNGVLNTIVSDYLSEQIANSAEEGVFDASELDLGDCFEVSQIKFYSQNYELDEAYTEVSMARLTISVGLSDLLSSLEKSMNVQKMIESMPELQSLGASAKSMVSSAFGIMRGILPKRIYLTLDMGLSHNVSPSVYINDMGMGNDKMNNLLNMFKKAGMDVQQMLDDAFVNPDGDIAKLMTDLNASVSLGEIIKDGAIDCDVYQLVIDLSKLNYEQTDNGEVLKPEQQRISSDDILNSLKIVLHDNGEYLNQLKGSEYSYKNVSFKRTESGELDMSSGEPVILEQGEQYYVTTADELNRLIGDYERYLLARFSNAYGLKANCTLDEIIETFTAENFSTEKALDLFDADKIKAVINGEANGVAITDKMLAAIFAKMLPSLLEGGEISSDCLGIEYIYLQQKQSDETHYVLNVGLNIDMSILIESSELDESVAKILKNIIGKTVIVEAGVDITLGMAEDEYMETTLSFNGLDVSALNKLLGAFGVLGTDESGNALTLSGFVDSMLSPVHELINNLGSTLGGLSLQPSEIKLPDVYALLSKAVNGSKSEDDADYVTAQTLKNALRLFINEGPIADDGSAYSFFRDQNATAINEYNASNEQALLNELSAKYGFNYTVNGYTLTLDEVLYVLGIGNLSDTSRVDGMKIYDLIDSAKLEELAFASGEWQKSLKASINNVTYVEDSAKSDMLTALVKKVVLGGSIDFSKFGDFNENDLLFVKLSEEGGKQYLSVTVKVLLSDVLPTLSDQSMQDFIDMLLPQSESIITFKVDVSADSGNSEAKIIINGNEEASESLFDMLKKMGNEFDLTSISNGVKDSFNTLKDTINVEIGDGELLLPNVFALIDDKLLDNMYDDDGASIKEALSGVMKTSETVPFGQTRTRRELLSDGIIGVKPNDDYSEFMNDIKTKYFIKGEAANATTIDGLYSYINVDNFNAAFIDVSGQNGMAYTTKQSDSTDAQNGLMPLLKLGDVGAMFKEKLSGKLQNAQVHSLSVNGDDLILNAFIPLSDVFTQSDDLKKLMPIEYFYVKVTINTVTLLDDGNTKYYECEITINDMGESQNKLFEIAKKLSGADAIDVSKLCKELGVAVHDAIKTLDDAYGEGNYKLTDGGIELKDIFTFIGTNVAKDKTLTAEQIKAAVQGMYQARSDGNNVNNYKLSDVVKNEIASSVDANIVSSLVNGTASLTDKELGAYLKTQVSDVGEVVQTNILAANPTASSKQLGDRNVLNGALDAALDSGKTYVQITVKADISKLEGDESMAANAKLLLPSEMYVTFVLVYENDSFGYVDFAINAMTAQQRQTLIKLIGIDFSLVQNNLRTEANKCISKVNEFFVGVKGFAALNGKTIIHDFTEVSDSTSARGQYACKEAA